MGIATEDTKWGNKVFRNAVFHAAISRRLYNGVLRCFNHIFKVALVVCGANREEVRSKHKWKRSEGDKFKIFFQSLSERCGLKNSRIEYSRDLFDILSEFKSIERATYLTKTHSYDTLKLPKINNLFMRYSVKCKGICLALQLWRYSIVLVVVWRV
jgi:hypothetical protein